MAPFWQRPMFLVGAGAVVAGVVWAWRSRRPAQGQQQADAPAPSAPAISGLDVTSFNMEQAAAFADALPPIAQPYADFFVRAGASKGVSPILLAAIMAVETGYGAGCKDIVCKGVSGHDFGLMQINDQAHPDFFKKQVNGKPAYQDPWTSIEYGAGVLRSSISYIKGKTSLTGDALLFAGVAGYNAGMGAVARAVNAGKNADSVTHGGTYATKVFARANELLNKMRAVVG